MTEPIGFAALQIIPSLDGVSAAIDKQLGGTLKAAGKRGGKDLAKGVGVGLKDLEHEVESASKAYDKLRDRAADALDKITVEVKKLAKARASGKEDQIAAAEARLNKARRDSARLSREAEQAHGALTASQKRLSDGADDTGRRLGGLGASMRNVGVIAGGAALAGFTALAAGVVTAGKGLYELGASLDEVSDNLQVKTGLSGAALDSLRASVEKLGTTNVPSSFAEISDVAAEVTRNLHVTGPELEALTSRLANLDRMGQSVDIRALSKTFRGFGVDAKDQVPALNSLYEASTKSGLSIDEMLSAMQKAGPALRQFGFDFGETAALAATFEEAGLDGEKAMAALNKAFAYFSKEGIPAEQGLRDIIARIRELGDAPEASELATKVFGAKGGAGFLEAIQNGTLDLQALQSSLQTTGLDINAVSDDTADWAEKWQNLKNDLAVALEPAATPLFDTVNGKLDELSTWVTGNQDKVIDFFVSMGEGAISAAEVTLTALAGVVDTLHLFDTIVMKGFSWLPGYDDQAAKEFNDSLGDLSDKLNAAADSDLFDDLRTGLRDVADEAKNASADTSGAITGIGAAAETSADDVDELKQSIENLGKVAPPQMPWLQPGAPGGATPGQNPLDIIAPTGAPGASASGLLPPGLKTPAGEGASFGGAGGAKYGLPAGTDIRQGAPGFPDWVYQVGKAFNLTPSTYPGHQEDRGQGNQGIDWWGKPEDQQRFAEYLAANAGSLSGLEDVIWQNPNTGARLGVNQGRVVGPDDPRSQDPSYFRNDWADHNDHVHTTQSAPIPLPATGDAVFTASAHGSKQEAGGLPGSLYQDADGRWRSSLPSWDHLIQRESTGTNQRQGIVDVKSGGNEAEGLFQITPATWRAHGGTKFAPSALGATPQQQAEVAAAIFSANPSGSDWGAGLSGREDPTQLLSELQGAGVQGPIDPSVTNAFGADYEPGIGTPGYDEYGKPGYYEVDPKQVREAQQRIEDQTERIREADETARQAQVAIDDLEVDADQAEKDAAIERKRKADYDAQVARRELDDLQAEFGEAQKGTFSPAKESSESSTGSSSVSGSGSGLSLPSSFSGFGSAIGEFAGGQIGSALEVFGVPDSPSWLGAASQLLGGLKVGGHDRSANGQLSGKSDGSLFDGGNMFGGAAPRSATPNLTGTPPPDNAGNVHGTRANQPPGPVYNISARDTEDMFIKAQRVERERSAAKLSRF